MTATETLTHEDCLDFGRSEQGDSCAGDTEYRMALSATGRSFPRCQKHWEARLEEQERISSSYPDSPIAPAWFDESAAGERWDDDY